MAAATNMKPTETAGIAYYYPQAGAVLAARDGKVEMPLDGTPLPLLSEDFSAAEPSYDAVGRGLYYLLRANPDAAFADRYAALLRDAYPHLLAELATHLVMLDKKDVDLPYLDRKINYLKIFSLLEPASHRFPLEIGATYVEKGLTLAALANTTLHLFSAEKYLRKALDLDATDIQTRHMLGQVCYLLGKYQETSSLWHDIITVVTPEVAEKIKQRLELIAAGKASLIPAVDYLQAVGVALEAYESGDYEEAAAIILDVIDAVAGFEESPLAEINYLLGLCYVRLDIPIYAEQYFHRTLELCPDYPEAMQELQKLGVLS